jgi:hypothetical protein
VKHVLRCSACCPCCTRIALPAMCRPLCRSAHVDQPTGHLVLHCCCYRCCQVYRNVEQYPSAEIVPGVLVVRLDAPVYFANVQWMEDKLVAYEAEALRWVEGWGGGWGLGISVLWSCNGGDGSRVVGSKLVACQVGRGGGLAVGDAAVLAVLDRLQCCRTAEHD